MQDSRWLALEVCIADYLKTNFLDSSIKKANEFETIYWAAYSEGGKDHIKKFMSELESKVMKLDD